MFHAGLDHLHRMPSEKLSDAETIVDTVAMRQLRHQTKNALQRIIAEIARSDLRSTPAGDALADEIERRICLSARISDALFGLTAAPGPLDMRLQALCNAAVSLLAHPKQTIGVDVSVTGTCPEALQAPIVQIAHEMVSNAVKHGMHMRLSGRITLRLWVDGSDEPSVTLLVSDDGWGPRKNAGGEGLPIMRALAEPHGGVVALSRDDGWTTARLDIPGGAPS